MFEMQSDSFSNQDDFTQKNIAPNSLRQAQIDKYFL